MKFKENNITVDGQKVFYWESGGQQKEIMVLLHGFPGNHMGLIDLANRLGQEYRLIIPDMPACGESESLKDSHTLKNYAKWLNDFLEELHIDQVIIIGHSFGARVSLVFSLYHAPKIKRLILTTPVVKLSGLIPQIASLKGYIAKMLPKYMQKQWLSNRLYHYAVGKVIFKSASYEKRKQITERDIKESKNLDARATIEIFDEFYKFDLTPFAKEVSINSLIIAGDKDRVAILKSVQELSEIMKGSTLVVMENSGHLLPLERPKATAKIIKNWLQNT